MRRKIKMSNEDEAMIIFEICVLLVIVLLVSFGCERNKEVNILRAKAIKAGVATMTYNIETGNEEFLFDVGKQNNE